MAAEDVPQNLRRKDLYHHIDMGFLNRRLALSSLSPTDREHIRQHASSGHDHLTRLQNDHLLVTYLIDMCDYMAAPTLLEALTLGQKTIVFRGCIQLSPCPEIYSAPRVTQDVILNLDFGKPVKLSYHTSHICSDTGRMTLSEGINRGYVEAIVGLLHNRGDKFEIEPIVIGAPTLGHPRNPKNDVLVWCSFDHGEVLPEDIDQFSRLREVVVRDTSEWMDVMKALPEKHVKEAFAKLLNEPTKKEWGGESNDHFSAAATLGGVRKTAAFLLKGPSNFREMTLDMCGARADQIYRLVKSGADISVVQHSHLIGEAVRATLKAHVVHPGKARKFCLIDGQATYRILQAYDLLPKH
jgi:hypothetical protein